MAERQPQLDHTGLEHAGPAAGSTRRQRHGGLAESWQATPFYQLLLRGKVPQKLERLPPPPYPGDTGRGQAILAGRLNCADQDFDSTRPPWAATDFSIAAAELHGFTWLDDLSALGTAEARTRARELIAGWIDANRKWQSFAWTPDTTARRLAAWLANAGFLLTGDDDALVDRFFPSLVRHTRHLQRTAHRALPGLDAVLAGKALLYAGGCGFGAAAFQRGLDIAVDEASRQVLADGGHAARSPATHLRFLAALIDCRNMVEAAGTPAPATLGTAIGNLGAALGVLRHRDGSLALFNGTGFETPAYVDHVLKQAGAPATLPAHLPQSGFIRLSAGRTVVIQDAGAPPSAPYDRDAHAGTLSFEMSHGADRLIVNCGARPGARTTWRQAQRATAAHSTLIFADTNSSETRAGGIGRGPKHVPASHEAGDGASLATTSHDGYRANFGLVHRRRLYLGAEGNDLRGEDVLSGRHEGRFAIRFHLHPDVQASLAQNSAAVLLRGPSGIAWRFQAANAALSLAESVFLAAPNGPRRTEQIVLSGARTETETVVKWGLRRIDRE